MLSLPAVLRAAKPNQPQLVVAMTRDGASTRQLLGHVNPWATCRIHKAHHWTPKIQHRSISTQNAPGQAQSFNPTLPAFSLAGKTTVITGGARGLGLAMSRALVLSGSSLAIVDINEDEAAKQAVEIANEFRRTYPKQSVPKITSHYADVSSKEEVDASIAEIIGEHSKITNLVACAGFCENCEAIDFPPDRIKRMLGVNIEGTYYYATGVARHMMEHEIAGNMVFIGSISGSIVNVPQPQAMYNASKAAVRHLAASLAVEWASRGIRVNCLSPGYMITEIAMKAKILMDNPGLKKEWESKIPQGRMGPPEELMGAVVFLSSDASSYITGEEIKVDGGYTVC